MSHLLRPESSRTEKPRRLRKILLRQSPRTLPRFPYVRTGSEAWQRLPPSKKRVKALVHVRMWYRTIAKKQHAEVRPERWEITWYVAEAYKKLRRLLGEQAAWSLVAGIEQSVVRIFGRRYRRDAVRALSRFSPHIAQAARRATYLAYERQYRSG
jgi:hypothetical protein